MRRSTGWRKKAWSARGIPSPGRARRAAAAVLSAQRERRGGAGGIDRGRPATMRRGRPAGRRAAVEPGVSHGPPPALERAVLWLVPPLVREEVAGDAWE